MVEMVVALVYISLICWTYGYITLRIFKGITAEQEAVLPCFGIVCITGLSFIAVLAGILSLIIPLGGMSAQIIMIMPGMAYWFASKKIKPDFFLTIKKLASTYRLPTMLLLLSLLFLILLMGSWVIIHPDTLRYHAQAIQWIENYKVIPGLVHVNVRYGLQSYWYLLCALFSFQFSHTKALTFINTAVLCWYLLFIIGKINEGLGKHAESSNKKLITGILFFLLLVMSFWDFGQLRLMAVSASPDFVSAIYIWLIFYLFISRKSKNEASSCMLVFFLSIIALTLKLSSAPVMLLSCYVLYRLILLKKKTAPALIALTVITFAPFIMRNVITSGYVVFPSSFPDLIHSDWKLDLLRTEQVRQYITAYAKIGSKATLGIHNGSAAKISDWLPVWWNNRSLAEKTAMGSLLISLFLCLGFIKKILQRSSSEVVVSLIVYMVGIIFWFMQAPDPRFGFGFIFPVQGLLIYQIVALYSSRFRRSKYFLAVSVYAFTVVIAAYSFYRVHYFFQAGNLYEPAGIAAIPYKKIAYHGIVFNIPQNGYDCCNTPAPCVYVNPSYQLRGRQITDGFKSSKSAVK